MHRVAWRWMVLIAALLSSAVHADDRGRIYPSIGFATDYRYNGVSLSDREGAWQANVHWQRQSVYAGVFASEVDFNDPSGTSYELDAYAGAALTRGQIEYAVEGLYAMFPEKNFSGPTYDFAQLKLRARYTGEAAVLGFSTSWIPEASFGTGEAWRVAAEFESRITDWLFGTANVGRRWIEIGADRTYWDAGFRLVVKRATLDVRYVATSLERANCGFNARACDPAIIATLNFKLPHFGL